MRSSTLIAFILPLSALAAPLFVRQASDIETESFINLRNGLNNAVRSLQKAFRLAIAPADAQVDDPELAAVISAIDPLSSLRKDRLFVTGRDALERGDVIPDDEYVASLARQSH